MIYFDSTRWGKAKHRSGLMRLTSRIREELGGVVTIATWDRQVRGFVTGKKPAPVQFAPDDWLLTVEQFNEAERPGLWEFLRHPPCRLAAMFHDAIPVKWPHITWPQSVQRHPEYMKMLAYFHRTWAISDATRRDFVEFWRWQGVTPRSETQVVELGADFDGDNRIIRDPVFPAGRPALLCVGIVEPRKNQTFLLDVAEALWADGLDFELHIVGRINPHFGPPIATRMRSLARRESRFHFHAAASDERLARLYATSKAVVFPTIAEGCGLPLLEALWRGVPCVCSDLPVLRENADGGGCLVAQVNDLEDWKAKLQTILTERETGARLQREAMARPLPRWADTARTLSTGLLA
jgi:glycosyltransferase involved in cell wall biosynthesis